MNQNSYPTNELGLYNMSGNVAEMVNDSNSEVKKEPGTAGGGWMDSPEEIKILSEDKYKGFVNGHPNIGFRVCFSHISTPPTDPKQNP